MNTEFQLNLQSADEPEVLTTIELETAAGYAVKSNVHAGAPASGSCPSSSVSQKYRGQYICMAINPC